MNPERCAERLFETLLEGDRDRARRLVAEALEEGLAPEALYTQVYWPVYERIERMHRADQMSNITHHLATRLLRVLVDQTAARLPRAQTASRSVLAVCGPTDPDELAAQMAVDLLEAAGFDVRFAGGGVAGDEILAAAQESQPDVLLFFASAPCDLPDIRRIIDAIREIGACRDLQVVVGGGVFNRADELAEEIGADLWASDPQGLVQEMRSKPDRRATESQRTVGRNKRARSAA